MNDSRHALKHWIEANSTQAEVARGVGCSEAHVSSILSGRKVPSLALAARLSKFTGGVVPVEAFVQPPEVAP